MKYFVVATLLWACFADETGAATPEAALTVQVSNGTPNGTAVKDDVVIVQVHQNGQLLHTLEGKVAADDKALFENVPTGNRMVAVAHVKHQDTMFSGQPVALRPAEGKVLADVQVFDVSRDKSKLSVETHHLILRARSEFLEITEYMQLKNSSDMAVNSEKRDGRNRPVVLEIMLPAGFENLKFSSYFEEDASVVTKEGFYDTMAIAPGEYQVSFSYTLDITSNTMDMVKKISLPTTNLVIFAELGPAKLQGLGQAENQLLRADGTQMEYYKRSNLAPAEEITFQITGFNVDTSGPATWVILVLVFSAVVALAILRLRPARS